eukprot:GHRQ01031785.1.p2 GENE.GHRQ01031785.1~~GHRQ01031785.1.p2  ORF type:complete len:107 (+),score=1.28 GHRQ01031785.1:334-654(+)
MHVLLGRRRHWPCRVSGLTDTPTCAKLSCRHMASSRGAGAVPYFAVIPYLQLASLQTCLQSLTRMLSTTTHLNNADWFDPWKGSCPLKASYSITPTDHRSTAVPSY